MSSILLLVFMTNAHYTASTQQVCIELNLGLIHKNMQLQIKVKCCLLFEHFLQ